MATAATAAPAVTAATADPAAAETTATTVAPAATAANALHLNSAADTRLSPERPESEPRWRSQKLDWNEEAGIWRFRWDTCLRTGPYLHATISA